MSKTDELEQYLFDAYTKRGLAKQLAKLTRENIKLRIFQYEVLNEIWGEGEN